MDKDIPRLSAIGSLINSVLPLSALRSIDGKWFISIGSQLMVTIISWDPSTSNSTLLLTVGQVRPFF
jgi:hypothetical protein